MKFLNRLHGASKLEVSTTVDHVNGDFEFSNR